MTRSLTGGLNAGPPELEASTIPLDYRGGGVGELDNKFKRKLLNASVSLGHTKFNELMFTKLPAHENT